MHSNRSDQTRSGRKKKTTQQNGCATPPIVAELPPPPPPLGTSTKSSSPLPPPLILPKIHACSPPTATSTPFSTYSRVSVLDSGQGSQPGSSLPSPSPVPSVIVNANATPNLPLLPRLYAFPMPSYAGSTVTSARGSSSRESDSSTQRRRASARLHRGSITPLTSRVTGMSPSPSPSPSLPSVSPRLLYASGVTPGSSSGVRVHTRARPTAAAHDARLPRRSSYSVEHGAAAAAVAKSGVHTRPRRGTIAEGSTKSKGGSAHGHKRGAVDKQPQRASSLVEPRVRQRSSKHAQVFADEPATTVQQPHGKASSTTRSGSSTSGNSAAGDGQHYAPEPLTSDRSRVEEGEEDTEADDSEYAYDDDFVSRSVSRQNTETGSLPIPDAVAVAPISNEQQHEIDEEVMPPPLFASAIPSSIPVNNHPEIEEELANHQSSQLSSSKQFDVLAESSPAAASMAEMILAEVVEVAPVLLSDAITTRSPFKRTEQALAKTARASGASGAGGGAGPGAGVGAGGRIGSGSRRKGGMMSPAPSAPASSKRPGATKHARQSPAATNVTNTHQSTPTPAPKKATPHSTSMRSPPTRSPSVAMNSTKKPRNMNGPLSPAAAAKLAPVPAADAPHVDGNASGDASSNGVGNNTQPDAGTDADADAGAVPDWKMQTTKLPSMRSPLQSYQMSEDDDDDELDTDRMNNANQQSLPSEIMRLTLLPSTLRTLMTSVSNNPASPDHSSTSPSSSPASRRTKSFSTTLEFCRPFRQPSDAPSNVVSPIHASSSSTSATASSSTSNTDSSSPSSLLPNIQTSLTQERELQSSTQWLPFFSSTSNFISSPHSNSTAPSQDATGRPPDPNDDAQQSRSEEGDDALAELEPAVFTFDTQWLQQMEDGHGGSGSREMTEGDGNSEMLSWPDTIDGESLVGDMEGERSTQRRRDLLIKLWHEAYCDNDDDDVSTSPDAGNVVADSPSSTSTGSGSMPFKRTLLAEFRTSLREFRQQSGELASAAAVAAATILSARDNQDPSLERTLPLSAKLPSVPRSALKSHPAASATGTGAHAHAHGHVRFFDYVEVFRISQQLDRTQPIVELADADDDSNEEGSEGITTSEPRDTAPERPPASNFPSMPTVSSLLPPVDLSTLILPDGASNSRRPSATRRSSTGNRASDRHPMLSPSPPPTTTPKPVRKRMHQPGRKTPASVQRNITSSPQQSVTHNAVPPKPKVSSTAPPSVPPSSSSYVRVQMQCTLSKDHHTPVRTPSSYSSTMRLYLWLAYGGTWHALHTCTTHCAVDEVDMPFTPFQLLQPNSPTLSPSGQVVPPNTSNIVIDAPLLVRCCMQTPKGRQAEEEEMRFETITSLRQVRDRMPHGLHKRNVATPRAWYNKSEFACS